jgi:hypothetical protein
MFLSVQDIRDKFNLHSKSFEPQIASAILSANRKIRLWVGADVYDAAASETAPTDADELLRAETVADAHSWLTMYYLSRAVGVKYSPDGAIKQQQDNGSPAMGSRIVTNSYLTPEELGRNEQKYYDTAEEIILPYLVAETTVTVTRTALPQAVRVVADW